METQPANKTKKQQKDDDKLQKKLIKNLEKEQNITEKKQKITEKKHLKELEKLKKNLTKKRKIKIMDEPTTTTIIEENVELPTGVSGDSPKERPLMQEPTVHRTKKQKDDDKLQKKLNEKLIKNLEKEQKITEKKHLKELEKLKKNLTKKRKIKIMDEPTTTTIIEEKVELPTGVSGDSPKERPLIQEPTVPRTKKQKPDLVKEPKQGKRISKKNIKIIKDTTIYIPMEQPVISKNYDKTIKNVDAFKNLGINILENLTEAELSDIIELTNKYYYNSMEPLMSDNDYDIVKEFIERKFPKNVAIAQIGAPIGKNKVTLPYEMWSMNKIKPDSNALVNWKGKYTGPYVLSCKLDGVSGLFFDGKLYTRGDGKVGQDISHLIPHLKLPKINDFAVRGEFIIPKLVFEEKYKSTFANPRNLVSGIVNSKTIDDKVNDLHFVTYEVVHPKMKPSEQMIKLQKLGFEVVFNHTEPDISNEVLSNSLLNLRQNYTYEIDGIIVADDNIHSRITGNPEHAFAFKMVLTDQIAEAKVVDVIWTPSKNGYLKPRVRIEPVKLGGVTIEYATGFNGRFIEENSIGIGALIQIIRSGDVIPYIKSITVPATKPKMPIVPYKWTDTHVDIVLENVSDDITVREKNVTVFFTSLEVDGLSGGNVKRLFKAGFDTVPKILKMDVSDFSKVEGFKTKLASKIHSSILDKVSKASLLDIMVASNKLGKGLGERKIRPMLETYPNILTSTDSNDKKIEMLKLIKGIGNENAVEFVNNIHNFLAFLSDCGLEYKLNVENTIIAPFTEQPIVIENILHPLYNKKIVMTKIRDREIIDILPTFGATLEDKMTKDVFVLIVKSKDDNSNKTEFAKKNNIPVMTPQEFKQQFLA